MTEHTVELVRPQSPWLRKGEDFDPGERLILVDGERWGHTLVRSKGPGGLAYRFHQDGGEDIMSVAVGDRPRSRSRPFIEVHSLSLRRRDPTDQRSTEQAVLDMARELVADGLLRDPAVLRREQEEAEARRQLRLAVDAEVHKAEFKLRAAQAISSDIFNRLTLDECNALADRVVEAMEWAQTQ